MADYWTEDELCSDFVPVFFDLETTGGGDCDEIIQIGATTKKRRNVFCQYMVPDGNIPPVITQLTGFTKSYSRLYHNGDLMQTTDVEDMLEDFLDYLRKFHKPVVLVAHNAFAFDCRFILNCYIQYDLIDELAEVVQGFCDSLPLIKHCLPDMESYRLEALVNELVDDDFEAHDALNDSLGLASIFQVEKISLDQILQFTRCFQDAVDKEEWRRTWKENLESLEPLEPSVPRKTLKRMAQAGIDMEVLTDLWYDEGEDGLERYLSKTMKGGKPRVTRSRWLLDAIIDGVEENL